jgi:hypothetical protein
MDKLSVSNEMAQLDSKNRNFYDELNEKERKDFSAYLCMRYAASVEGSADFQEWYLRATNERANKNLFDINQHPKLQWLCLTTVSPDMGKFKHYWQANKKKDSGGNKVKKFILKLYPHLKDDELDLMAKLNDLATLKQHAKEMGMSNEEIKKELG